VVLLAAGVLPSCAQENPLSSPTLGFVFDEAMGRIRPIFGVTGASKLGEPLEMDFEIHAAEVSPRQDYILALVGNNREVVQIRISRGMASVRTLLPIAPAPDKIVLSPRGTAGAVYYRSSGKVQIITGLPDEPVLHSEVDLSALVLAPGVIAVSDDGQALLMTPVEDGVGRLYLAAPGGDVRPIFALRRVSAIEFLAQSHDAVIADSEENKVYLLRGTGGPEQLLVLAEEKDGVMVPRAVAVASDGRQVVVLNEQSKGLVIVSLDGATPAKLACDCVATGLFRLEGNAVFRLTGLSAGPAWVYDGDGAQPRVVFVPPASERLRRSVETRRPVRGSER
jgi:hypothetical protein